MSPPFMSVRAWSASDAFGSTITAVVVGAPIADGTAAVADVAAGICVVVSVADAATDAGTAGVAAAMGGGAAAG